MTKIFKELIILIGIAGLIWLGVSYFDIFPENTSLISEETESEIGEKYLEAILKNPMFERCDNDYVNASVDTIGRILEKAIETPLYDYNYIVVRNTMINAFTIPGGNIIITTGLIEYCESADELAGVVAHELGHAQERHIITRLIKELGIEILSAGDPFVLGEITKAITSASFDRKQEDIADQYACQLLEKAHLEPRILARLFRRLKDETDTEMLNHFEIVSSHPNFSSRIKNILAYKVPENFRSDTINIDWESIKDDLSEKIP